MPRKITPNPSEPSESSNSGETPTPDASKPSSEAPNTDQAFHQKSAFELFGEHQANAAKESWEAVQAFFPPEFKSHSRAARREFTQSFKVLLDGAQVVLERELERIRKVREAMDNKPDDSSDDGGNGPSSAGKSKVKIEVN